MSSARSDSTANHTRFSIQQSQLGNALWRESLPSMPPAHVCHEAVVRVPNACLQIQATLGAWQERSSRLVWWSRALLVFLHWASTLKPLLLVLAVPRPLFRSFSSHHIPNWIQPNSFQLLLLPISSNRPPWLVSTASASRPEDRPPCHLYRHLLFKHQGVTLWPLDARIGSFAHAYSCRSPHTSPCLRSIFFTSCRQTTTLSSPPPPAL